MTPYSETIEDAELKDKVLRITARHGDEFQSCVFQRADGGDFHKRWWVANREDSETWVVTCFETALALYDAGNDDEDAPAAQTALKQSTVLRGCFMDALHACAHLEKSERDLFADRTGPSPAQLGDCYFKTFAENEGIPIDPVTQMPVPAANKIILAEQSNLPVDALEILAKSKGNLAEKPVPPVSATALLGDGFRAPMALQTASHTPKNALVSVEKNLTALSSRKKRADGIMTGFEQRRRNLERLSAVPDALDEMPRRLAAKENSPVKTLTSTFFLAVHSAPLAACAILGAPLLAGVMGGAASVLVMGVMLPSFYGIEKGKGPDEVLPVSLGLEAIAASGRGAKKAGLSLWGRQRLCTRFSRAAARERQAVLEDDASSEAQKSEQIQQINLAETGFYALAARQAYNVAADGGGWLKRRQAQKALKAFAHVARRCAFPEDEIPGMIRDICSDPVPPDARDPFASEQQTRLFSRIDAAQAALSESKNRQLDCLPPPPPGR